MNYSSLIEHVESFVKSKDGLKQLSELPYHNIKHTEQIVRYATQIAKHYKLGDKEYFIIISAAWFHNYGYYLGEVLEREERSAEISSADEPLLHTTL